MKTTVSSFILSVFWMSLLAQVPQKMSYQAVIRDAAGNLVTNKQITMRITILQGTLPGSMVYQEMQSPVTNENGLVTVEIGGDIRFEIINWGSGDHYIKTEIDPAGGLNYTIIATSQLLSVPYAQYAKSAGTSPPWLQFGSNIYYNNGHVGIGVTEPVFNLDIRGTNTDKSGIMVLGNADLSHKMIFYGGRENDPNPFIQWKEGDPLRFSTDQGGWSEKMRIDTAGNVGIGTENPGAKLDVAGEIKVNDHRIRNVADPVNAQDAATKAYVDELLVNALALLPANFAGIASDIEGNRYKIVKIGSQVWMAENLRTGQFSDGAPIPLVTDNTAWVNLTTPGYCWYNNDRITCGTIYGALYNWYAVNTGKLCPAGWHVPSDAEWTTLTTFLGGVSVSGGMMKEAGTAHWESPNAGATNESGFSGLPGGDRYSNGGFSDVGNLGDFWSSTEGSPSNAYVWSLWSISTYLSHGSVHKLHGFSVRCLKDI